MELYTVLSTLVLLSALFSYINARFIKMPSTVGVMMIALLLALVMVSFGSFSPKTVVQLKTLVNSVDLHEVLMGVMLNFLLFAGAMHVKINDLKEERLAILVLSTLSVFISTFIVGTLLYCLILFTSFSVSFIECLIFGSLISPTDPIAVLGVLKNAKVKRSIEIKVAGESLFNDGVSIVLFVTLVGIAMNEGELHVSAFEIASKLVQEIFGGLLLGVVYGFVASKLMKNINNYNVDVMITLSVVMGGAVFANSVGCSSPLAMVMSGLFIGNYGRQVAMTPLSREYLDKFWELVDEMMNAILFLLIGLQLLIIPVRDIQNYWGLGVLCILIVLIARFFSIWLPTKFFHIKDIFTRKTTAILVWGGLRGGVSVALVLSLQAPLNKNLMLVCTFFVVVFSIFVQGMTISKIAKKVV